MGGMPHRNLARDLIYAYLIVYAFHTLPRLRKKSNLQTRLETLISRLKDPIILKEVLFLLALPRTYGALSRRYPASIIPPLLSAPLLNLIEPSLQRTSAIYTATVAAANFNRSSSLRRLLPPAWTLIFPANAWLLWSFLFQSECFPRGYGDLILRHSGYVSEPTNQLVEYLRLTKFEEHPPGVLAKTETGQTLNAKSSIHPDHTRAVCARLHPATHSCLETYIRAWVSEFPRVWKWVGGFGILALALRQRGKLLDRPQKTFRDWVISTTRGTAFVVGTINTSWGLTCLLQHALSPESLPHLRWIVNGTLGNLWILVLPAARRAELALYCTRLALGSLWDFSGVPAQYHGEIVLFALAWTSLLRDRRNGMGPKGLAELILHYLDDNSEHK